MKTKPTKSLKAAKKSFKQELDRVAPKIQWTKDPDIDMWYSRGGNFKIYKLSGSKKYVSMFEGMHITNSDSLQTAKAACQDFATRMQKLFNGKQEL